MSAAEEPTSTRPGAAARRRQVEAYLAALQPGSGNYPSAWARNPQGGFAAHLERLGRTLEEMGPVFSGFGRDLGCRVDLLGEEERRALRRVRLLRPPMAPEQVADLVKSLLGAPTPALFASFEPLPAGTALASQIHQASLAGGAEVFVQISDPCFRRYSERDLPLLPLLEPAFEGVLAPEALAAAIADFAAAVERHGDLTVQARLLETAAADSPSLGPAARLPGVVGARSAPGILTLEALGGAPLSRLPGTAAGAGGAAREELSVRLCHGWLRLAFFGSAYPVVFGTEDVVLLPDRTVGWQGGSFARLEGASQLNLWAYLQAAAAREPDAAAAALLGELTGGPEDDGSSLRKRLRQAVPLRDGGWGAREDLAGELFTHARIVTELAYRPSPALVDWWRGLARLAELARPLAWRRDPLHEAVDGTRLLDQISSMWGLAQAAPLQENLGSAMTSLLTLPQKLDKALTLASDGRANLRLEVVEPPETKQRKDATAAGLAGVLAIAALALLAHQISDLLPQPWGERIAAGLLVVVGLLFLPRLLK